MPRFCSRIARHPSMRSATPERNKRASAISSQTSCHSYQECIGPHQKPSPSSPPRVSGLPSDLPTAIRTLVLLCSRRFAPRPKAGLNRLADPGRRVSLTRGASPSFSSGGSSWCSGRAFRTWPRGFDSIRLHLILSTPSDSVARLGGADMHVIQHICVYA